jgi:hypothetical protein
VTLLDTFHRRRDYRDDVAQVDAIVAVFREACVGAQLGIAIDSPIAGTSIRTPEVSYVVLGPPVQLTIRMPPGMVPASVQRAGPLIAPHLGGVQLRVQDRGRGWAVVTVLNTDPLDGVLPLHLPRPAHNVLIGRDEGGVELVEDWHRGAHTIVQGVTRSGKSVWTYGVLAQLARPQDIIVGGCDPTGLLWRPFAGSRHCEWQVSGLADLNAHETLLQRLVDEMDHRIAELPADRDVLEVTPSCPLLVVVLEELAGLYRALDAAKTRESDPGKRVRALIGRLLCEGAKVGVRVIILVQRAEAAVVDAMARAMCSLRISFRCDNRASVELLHPGADPTMADGHSIAPPGIALMTAPGRALTRMRAPFLGGYPEYAAAVSSACAP